MSSDAMAGEEQQQEEEEEEEPGGHWGALARAMTVHADAVGAACPPHLARFVQLSVIARGGAKALAIADVFLPRQVGDRQPSRSRAASGCWR